MLIESIKLVDKFFIETSNSRELYADYIFIFLSNGYKV